MSGGIAAGCARPGGDGGRLTRPPRRRARTWAEIMAAIVVLATLTGGVSVCLLSRSGPWVLAAPATAAGLARDHNSVDQISFGSAVARFRSSVTSLPQYRHLTSTVSAVYALGAHQAVGFVGLNGTFGEQVTLTTTRHLAVTAVNPGPHGGAAECGNSRSGTVCDWSTGSTVGIVLIAPTNGAGPREPVPAADRLMIRIRGAVERPSRRGLPRGGSGRDGQATTGGAPDSLVMSRPADCQPSIPSATLMARQPPWLRASVARADRAPDLQMT
jgi:hypothetical protein